MYVSCWIFHEIKPCREPKCIFPKIHWTIGPIFKWELAILLGAILTFPDSKLLCKKQDWKLLHLELKFKDCKNQGTRFRLPKHKNKSQQQKFKRVWNHCWEINENYLKLKKKVYEKVYNVKDWENIHKSLDDININFEEINGILLPKLFWLTVRKNCSIDR